MIGAVRARRLVTGVLAAGAFVVIAVIPSVASSHDLPGAEIDICCAWNGAALADDELTYKISGGSSTLQERAAEGVENWETLPGALTFTPVSGNTKADITIKIANGGGPFVAGQTGLKFRRDRTTSDFFIKAASITVFGARRGDGDEVEEIAAHEFGHALGVGHANESGFLMSSSLPEIPGPVPTACDRDAVVAANQWYFGNPPPAPPRVDHVHC
jgi:Matrixin